MKQDSKYRSGFTAQTLVRLALMIALQITLTRILVVEIGQTLRISFGSVATILAGLWFGPVCGGLCGLCADILGCLIRGYVINPLITAAAVLWGVLPALVCLHIPSAASRRQKSLWLCLSIFGAGILSSLVLTTAGLVWMYQLSLAAVLPGRLIQSLIMIPCYCLIVCLLYYSPLTRVVTAP